MFISKRTRKKKRAENRIEDTKCLHICTKYKSPSSSFVSVSRKLKNVGLTVFVQVNYFSSWANSATWRNSALRQDSAPWFVRFTSFYRQVRQEHQNAESVAEYPTVQWVVDFASEIKRLGTEIKSSNISHVKGVAVDFEKLKNDSDTNYLPRLITFVQIQYGISTMKRCAHWFCASYW